MKYIKHLKLQEENESYVIKANSVLSLQRMASNKLVVLKIFAYLPSAEPFVAFFREGYVDSYKLYDIIQYGDDQQVYEEEGGQRNEDGEEEFLQ